MGENVKECVSFLVENKDVVLPLISGFMGTALGATVAYISARAVDKSQKKDKSEALTASLVAEVAALLEIIEARRYLEGAEKIRQGLVAADVGAVASMTVIVPEHYSRIFQANASEIGLLDAETATSIVRFHQLIDSVVQDIKPGGVLSEGAELESFNESYNILQAAITLGKSIKNKYES